MYSPKLLDHFQNPRHAGELDSPDARVRVENPVCGDILELSATCSDGHIAEIRFRAKGCVPAMACGSAVAALLASASLATAVQITKGAILAEVGGVPPASGHAAQLATDAAEALLRDLASKS